MTRILTVFGTRPEAIKMYPVIEELKKRKTMNVRIAVTAQHREMLDGVLEEFSIKPDFDLSLMISGQSLCDFTAKALVGVQSVIRETLPDVIMVHGDTATAYASGMAAFFCGVPLAHVEAGLRTYNAKEPFPEEFFRRSLATVSDYNFAPTEKAAENLLGEGVSRDRVFVTGNTAVDTLLYTVKEEYRSPLTDRCRDGRTVMLTLHRRESIGAPMRAVFRAVRRIAGSLPDIRIVYPMHKNPEVRKIAAEELSLSDRIIVTEPLSVHDFHNMLARSALVLTDSGGVQEECAFLGKPTLVARRVTERPEALSASCRLVGVEEEGIYRALFLLLTDECEYRAASVRTDAFGKGDAAIKIADALETSEN